MHSSMIDKQAARRMSGRVVKEGGLTMLDFDEAPDVTVKMFS